MKSFTVIISFLNLRREFAKYLNITICSKDASWCKCYFLSRTFPTYAISHPELRSKQYDFHIVVILRFPAINTLPDKHFITKMYLFS